LSTRRRILFFADASHIHTRRWVTAMAERGFDCHVATRLPGDIAKATVHVLAPGADALGWFTALPAARRLARQLAPSWIHGHYVTSYGLWAAACAGMAPVVLTAWGSDILVTPREPGLRGQAMAALVRWSLRRACLLTADSQDVLQAMANYAPNAMAHEVLWGVDTERFCLPTHAREDRFEMISMRQWMPNYNVDVVLEALALVRQRRPAARAHLSLLGGGPLAGALREQVKRLGLNDEAVSFLGHSDEDGMVAALQRSHVSITVPSSDATSVAMLESMACGTAVVATDLPANRAWIDAPWRVPARDPQALANALLRLADNRDLCEQLGHTLRERIEQRASRRVHMDRMAALYESINP
jgi:glycosyltransferase involved in cell wall biosynthesis